ncbi:MAG: GH1 family beta-glucosidase [Candidatus Latescibacterota bacterium]|nr:GH1 family beta-glucosidase [Candidatus Latescibacterota bacterium]
MSFPDNFVWGAAAASYQIEGGAYEDGKGLSVWDMMCRQQGRVYAGHTGDVAIDHYHRYKEDVVLMKQMGLMAYRLSISWPRVLPEGVGPVNEAGLDFYDRLVDELVAADIVPYVTLFHWDFPHALYCRGGWLNPQSPEWFAEYAEVVVDKLSDRVKHWMTLNEPQCFIGLGLLDGIHAPGDKLGLEEVLLAGHHALLAHGRSVQVIRARAKLESSIGYAPTGSPVMPVDETDKDNVEQARKAMFAVKNRNCWNISWWSDPVILGHYPEDGLSTYGSAAPKFKDSDFDIMCQPLDFYGTNIYNGWTIGRNEQGRFRQVDRSQGNPICANKWPVTPEALYWGARFYHERYGLPIIITENGLSNQDWVSLDGKVHDPQRIDFTKRYLLEFKRAGEEGIPIEGYFHWSVFDNFEWAEGYKERFGMVYVDYQTQERILKDSAHWYRTVIESNGAVLGPN